MNRSTRRRFRHTLLALLALAGSIGIATAAEVGAGVYGWVLLLAAVAGMAMLYVLLHPRQAERTGTLGRATLLTVGIAPPAAVLVAIGAGATDVAREETLGALLATFVWLLLAAAFTTMLASRSAARRHPTEVRRVRHTTPRATASSPRSPTAAGPGVRDRAAR